MPARARRIFLSPLDVGERERRAVLEAFATGYVAPSGPMAQAQLRVCGATC